MQEGNPVMGAGSFQITIDVKPDGQIFAFLTFKSGGQFDTSELVVAQFAMTYQGLNDLGIHIDAIRDKFGRLPLTPQ